MNEKDVEEARTIIKQLQENYLLMESENKKLRHIADNLDYWRSLSVEGMRLAIGEISYDTYLSIRAVLNSIANTRIESHGTG